MSGRILVVEDNKINQKVISFLLARLGHVFDVVATGAACLKAIEVQRYRLILMDLRLPDMSGCDAAKLIRKQGFTVPIVAVSAEDIPTGLRKCLDAGMDGYLEKPIAIAKLEELLNQWLPAAKLVS